jgi:hypothetical protein
VDLEHRYRELVDALTADGVRLITKDRVWHQRALDRLLPALTLGGQSAYLDRYVTTIGRSIYLTPDWERRPLADRYATLRHEKVHLDQFRRWGLVPMAIAYLLLPLPVGSPGAACASNAPPTRRPCGCAMRSAAAAPSRRCANM